MIDITDFTERYNIEYEMCLTSAEHGHTVRAALPEDCEPIRRNSHVGYYFDSKTFRKHQSTLEALAADLTITQGSGHHRRPYQFDTADFVQFLGWFVAEGSVSWRQHKNTAQIGIAQKTARHRDAIRALFDRLGLSVTETENGFSFGSALWGNLLEHLCGGSSREKRLPDFVWGLSSEHLHLLRDTLIAGDGNDQGVYYTTSKRLRDDVCRLWFELGIKPRYTIRRDVWHLYSSTGADTIDTTRHISTVDPSKTTLYRLGVEDYSAVMAGRDGKFQWIPVSTVE